jgi:MFS family permease
MGCDGIRVEDSRRLGDALRQAVASGKPNQHSVAGPHAPGLDRGHDRAPNVTVMLLAACQAPLLTNNAILFGLNAIVGDRLTDIKWLSTLPLTTYVIGTAAMTIPAALWMKRVGRRLGFMSGAVLGFFGSGLCALALARSDFWLLCAGSVLVGSYNAFGQQYRFAAAEAVPASGRSQAISKVLAGGLVGAFAGPESGKLTKDAFDVMFLGPYLVMSALALAAIALQAVVRFAPPVAESGAAAAEPARPLGEVLRQPKAVVAILSAVVGYGVMNFLMTSTPLAMIHHHHHYDDTAFVIEWHIVAMFAPSFFTGWLIKRVGLLTVLIAGAGLLLGCVAVAAWDVTLFNFWTANFLHGVGWNFLYIGGTTLLTEAYRPSERAKVQGVNDFIIFGTMAATSLSSGALLHHVGWQAMTVGMLPFVVLALAALLWFAAAGRRAAAA